MFIHRSRRNLIFLVGGVVVGSAAVGITLMGNEVTALFHRLREFSDALAFAATPLGFALCAWLAVRYFPNTQGSGIPQVIAARELDSVEAREKLVSIRVGIGKIILLGLALLVGASAGREGPTVQVGAAIMFMVVRFSPKLQPGLLLAGAGAGVASAFNAPIAGIVFAIEELGQTFDTRTNGLIVMTVLIAGVVVVAMLGDYTYFGTTQAALPMAQTWLVSGVIGVVGGLMGALFSFIILRVPHGMPGRAGRVIRQHPVVFSLFCGIGVAVCGLMSGGATDGSGYEPARAIVHDAAGGIPMDFVILKFGSTVFSTLSGIPGGLFSPSLSIGSGIGQVMSQVFPALPLGALALLGMVSYLTGVLQAPVTSFVIVAELTQNSEMMFPLMITAMVAKVTARIFNRDGLYHAMAKFYLPQDGAPRSL